MTQLKPLMPSVVQPIADWTIAKDEAVRLFLNRYLQMARNVNRLEDLMTLTRRHVNADLYVFLMYHRNGQRYIVSGRAPQEQAFEQYQDVRRRSLDGIARFAGGDGTWVHYIWQSEPLNKCYLKVSFVRRVMLAGEDVIVGTGYPYLYCAALPGDVVGRAQSTGTFYVHDEIRGEVSRGNLTDVDVGQVVLHGEHASVVGGPGSGSADPYPVGGGPGSVDPYPVGGGPLPGADRLPIVGPPDKYGLGNNPRGGIVKRCNKCGH